MIAKILSVAILGLTGVGLAAVPQAEADPTKCPALDGLKSPELLDYLKQDRTSLPKGCVARAMSALGLDKYTPAIKVLVTYLDYRGPDDPYRARYGVVLHAFWPPYPAEHALFMIGKPAIPDLVAVLAAPGASDIVRGNALLALNDILRDEPGGAIATLVKASKATTDIGASQRLLDAAKQAAARCPADMMYLCINALEEK